MHKGFTLIETVMTIAVLALVTGVATDIFVSIVQHQRRMLADQEFVSQASYALEYLSRSLRTAIGAVDATCLPASGNYYQLTHPNAVSNVYEGIRFISADGVCHEFFFDRPSNTFKESKNGGQAANLISSKFPLRYVRFILNGGSAVQVASNNDKFQPRVTVLLDALPVSPFSQQDKVLETTVSQRNLNPPS